MAMLNVNTKWLLSPGMGGNRNGAAPIIAQMARNEYINR